MPASGAAERHRELSAHRAVRFTAREIEARRPVDRENWGSVFYEALRQGKDVAFSRTRSACAKQRIDRDDGLARRLHQHATWHPVLGARRRIPRCRLARRQHRNWIHVITTPAYPTTRALSPDTQPEWR